MIIKEPETQKGPISLFQECHPRGEEKKPVLEIIIEERSVLAALVSRGE